MNFTAPELLQKQKVKIYNLLPKIGVEGARKEIIAGLTAAKRTISSKYFYDEKGSALFEEITGLQEYYPTRIEKTILAEIAPELMNRGSSFEIVELGSGDCSKISILLGAVEKWATKNVEYIPVDVSCSAIEKSVGELAENFPQLKINGYVADFIHQTKFIRHSAKLRLVFFLGSTIGNFLKKDSKKIISNLAKVIEKGDSLFVGFDLVKPIPLLQAAYNDLQGVTERFNKNILNVVNSIILTDFNTEEFDHVSFFDNENSRIEMHLAANKNCIVQSPLLEKPIRFAKGDSIQTENSHKYKLEDFGLLNENTGLTIRNVFTDPKNWFAVVEFGK